MDKAPKVNSTVATLVVAALAAGGIALTVEHWRATKESQGKASGLSVIAQSTNAAVPPVQAQRSTSATRSTWSASAPGRVEPRGGEIRLGAQMPGKVAQVLVRMNDNVKAGDLLVSLVDDELTARLEGATAEASVRRRERDSEPGPRQPVERRNAEDAVFTAERAAFRARMDLDKLQSAAARGESGAGKTEIEAARSALSEANERVTREQAALRRLNAQPNQPLPTRLEASLAVARSELSAIETAVERTRVRAPSDGTILIVNSRIGETVSPSPEDVLLLFGDVSQLRVRAEIEERDVGKIRPGQGVVVRSDAFPGQDFTGRIDVMANALGQPRLAVKGPRRPNDQDVLQVLVELDGRPPLIPGMRVDVFFKPDATVGAKPAEPNARN
jgi:HlyD family secretion protein